MTLIYRWSGGHIFKVLQNSLKKTQEQIENKVNENVSFDEIFDLGFMDKNGDFESFEALIKHYGFLVNTQKNSKR